MSPDIWRSIAVGALIAGIIFLIIAMILSVKFHLLSIIRSTLESRGEGKESAKRGFFDHRQESVIERSTSAPIVIQPRNESAPVSRRTEPSATVISDESKTTATVISQNEGITATVITHDEAADTGGTVIISPDEPETVPDNDEFIILKSVIVINGSTDSVKCHKSK